MELIVFVAGATLLVFALSAIALVIYTRGAEAPADVIFVIPSGSGVAVDNGASIPEIPPVWSFNIGDTLTLDNRDTVVHMLGDLTVSQNRSLVIPIEPSVDGEHLTTLHPTGIVTVNVEPSGFDFSIIAYTTFAFGISIGIIVYVGYSIARAMGRHDDEDWVDG